LVRRGIGGGFMRTLLGCYDVDLLSIRLIVIYYINLENNMIW
jgi:hypothetical protein